MATSSPSSSYSYSPISLTDAQVEDYFVSRAAESLKCISQDILDGADARRLDSSVLLPECVTLNNPTKLNCQFVVEGEHKLRCKIFYSSEDEYQFLDNYMLKKFVRFVISLLSQAVETSKIESKNIRQRLPENHETLPFIREDLFRIENIKFSIVTKPIETKISKKIFKSLCNFKEYVQEDGMYFVAPFDRNNFLISSKHLPKLQFVPKGKVATTPPSSIVMLKGKIIGRGAYLELFNTVGEPVTGSKNECLFIKYFTKILCHHLTEFPKGSRVNFKGIIVEKSGIDTIVNHLFTMKRQKLAVI